ncbi:MAG: SPASM domain-containing protein [Pseudomonadota bacterium]
MNYIYWVISWACHRKCKHCYDDRFRPYVRDALDEVVAEGQHAYERIIAHLPDDFTYLDPCKPDADAEPRRIRGSLFLAGGEPLIDAVREPLFYPLLERIGARYGGYDAPHAPRLACQTTGDILTEQHIEEMLERGMWKICIASIDDYHVGMEGDKKLRLMEKVSRMMEKFGVREEVLAAGPNPRNPAGDVDYEADDGPFFVFFGAQPELWIGEIWPRGRAWTNGLSKADYGTNFCARRSGGRHFLDHGQRGSEVAIEPDGSVYPCCLKTKTPIGNIAEEPLIPMLDSLRGHPALEALNRGDPEAMGLEAGWDREAFRVKSKTVTPKGEDFENLCIGCDRFFEQHLGEALKQMREERMQARKAAVSVG